MQQLSQGKAATLNTDGHGVTDEKLGFVLCRITGIFICWGSLLSSGQSPSTLDDDEVRLLDIPEMTHALTIEVSDGFIILGGDNPLMGLLCNVNRANEEALRSYGLVGPEW